MFSEQHKDWGERPVREDDGITRKKRVNLRESPLTTLSHKKDKDGRAFLGSDLIEAEDRLREDFELSQMGPRVGQNWERFLTGGYTGNFGSTEGGSSAAQDRLQAALSALGPGLGDIAMRCCWLLEGLEAAENVWDGQHDQARLCCGLPCNGCGCTTTQIISQIRVKLVEL